MELDSEWVVEDGYSVNFWDHKWLNEGKLALRIGLSKPLEVSSGIVVAGFIGSNNAWK